MRSLCAMCVQSYCGGEANCAEQISASDDYDPTELVCPPCAHVGGALQVGTLRSVANICNFLVNKRLRNIIWVSLVKASTASYLDWSQITHKS